MENPFKSGENRKAILIMSQLDCLSIRGIRSFSDESVELVTFAKPLTVITGANGCGKTTIIECLKYAATGELPPGTTSGGFNFYGGGCWIDR